MIITNGFAIGIEVTIFSCDGLVVITNKFAIIIEVTRLTCDGLVIIAQPDCTFGPRLNLVQSTLPCFPPFLIILNSWLKINSPEAGVETINSFICWMLYAKITLHTAAEPGVCANERNST